MGTFLALSGIIGADRDHVFDALAAHAAASGERLQRCDGTTEDPGVGALHAHDAKVSVLYPNGFDAWDAASEELSRTLSAPVFSLHIHDSALWMYRLFDHGREVDRFNPLPDYWEPVDEAERARWRGDPNIVSATVPGVAPDRVASYLVPWDAEAVGDDKAYPDDEFPIGSDWQVCDFMRALGLPYPLDDAGNILGQAFRLTHARARKPWWKLW